MVKEEKNQPASPNIENAGTQTGTTVQNQDEMKDNPVDSCSSQKEQTTPLTEVSIVVLVNDEDVKDEKLKALFLAAFVKNFKGRKFNLFFLSNDKDFKSDDFNLIVGEPTIGNAIDEITASTNMADEVVIINMRMILLNKVSLYDLSIMKKNAMKELIPLLGMNRYHLDELDVEAIKLQEWTKDNIILPVVRDVPDLSLTRNMAKDNKALWLRNKNAKGVFDFIDDWTKNHR